MHVVRSGAVSALAIGLVLAGSGLPSPLWAQAVDPVATPSQTQAMRAAPAEPSLGMRAAERVQMIGKSDAHADDIAAIETYHAANSGKPLWIEGAALSHRARAAIDEIGKADDWGLIPSVHNLDSCCVGAIPLIARS